MVDGQRLRAVARGGSARPQVPVGASVPLGRDLVAGAAVLEGRIVHVPDLARAAARGKLAGAAAPIAGRRTLGGSILAAPVLLEGQVVGVIALRRPRVHPFSPAEIALLHAFAEHVAVAIESARRGDALAESFAREEAEAEILGIISRSAGDLQPVLDAVVARAARICGGFDCALLLADGGALELRAHQGTVGTPSIGTSWPIERGTVMGRAVLDRTTVQVEDLAEADEAEYPTGRAIARQTGHRTTLATPLLCGREAIGVILIRRAEVRLFSELEVAALRTFADQAVIAIENARLFAELGDRNAELTRGLEREQALGEILRIISRSPTNVEPVFEGILSRATRLAGADFGAVFEVRDGQLHLMATVASNPAWASVAAAAFPASLEGDAAWAARTLARGRVRFVEDAQAVPLEATRRLARAGHGFRSVLIVPMLRQGQGIGLINLGWAEIRPYPERIVPILEAFADQAVIAIENTRLFRELEARNRDLTQALEQQTATAEILRVISGSPTDTAPVFQAIIDRATRLSGAQLGLVWRYVGGTVFRAAAASGATPAFAADAQVPRRFERPYFREGGPWRATQIPDVRETEPYRSGGEFWRRTADDEGMRTLLMVPLVQEDRLIGSIAIYRREVRPFTDTQIDLVRTFADQAVIAIENVRLFTELEVRNRDLSEALEQQTATAEILRVISSSPTDVQPVLEMIAQRSGEVCGGFFCVVFMVQGDHVHLRASHNIPASISSVFASVYPAPLTSPLRSVQAVREGRAIAVADMQDEAGAPPGLAERSRAYGLRSWVAVPMMRGGCGIGAIAVGRREMRPFSEKDVALLRTFADQAVIAIENVRLFTELEQRNRALTVALDQQTATAEVLRVISSSPTDAQPVFETIAASAVRLTGGVTGGVYEYDGSLVHLRAMHPPGWPNAERFSSFFPRPLAPDYAAGRVILDRALLHVADLLTDPDTPATTRAWAEELGGLRSVLWVPLLREGHAVGVISVVRSEPGLFSDDQVRLLQTFADQAVIAIENVRLFTELEARNHALTVALDQQTATAEILRVISRSPADLQPVFDAIADSAMRLFQAWSANVCRFDGELVHLVATRGGPGTIGPSIRDRFPTPPTAGLTVGRCILDHAVIQIDDVETDPGPVPATREMARARGWRSALAVPMLREGQPVGALMVTREAPGGFETGSVDLLQTFADQAVIAIENARLFSELEVRNGDLSEALERQTATADILRVISASPTDVQPVFDSIARHAVALCGGLAGLVVRYDGTLMHLVAHHNVGPERARQEGDRFPRSPDGSMPLDTAVLEARTCHVTDLQGAPQYVAAPARRAGLGSVIAVPLRREGAAIGGIGISRAEPEGFTDRQIALLETFADQAVIAIENVRLFRELEAKNRDLTETLEQQTATADILRVIGASPTDVRPVFEAILRSAVGLCDGYFAACFTVDDQRLHLVATHDVPEKAQEVLRESFPVPLDADLVITRAARERCVVHVRDIQSEGARTRRPLSQAVGERALVAVPLVRRDIAVGVITVSRREAREFSDKEISLLQTFADQAVIAIENVRLFKELRGRTTELTHSVEQLTALGEVGQAVSSSLDLETVLTTIVSRAVALTGADAGVVFEYDEATGEFAHRAGTETSGPLAEARRTARIRKGEGVLGRTAITHEPVQVADIAREGVYEGRLRGTLLESGVRALLAVPMLREGRLLGGLVLSRNQPGEFPPSTVDLLRTFATQSALAIQNARLYRELAEQGRQLEVASRHKSEFLASMSHELRTPLNAILGFNEMILGEIYGEIPSDLREPLTEMQNSGRHLLRLINNVLDLSKIEAGRMELALADYAVQDAVEQVRASLHPLAADKGLELVTAVPADLPLAHGDAGRISQCLTNLVGNAIKFTRQGRVEIAAELRDETLVYRVSDTGIGIAPDRIETLFTEFRQADATIASEFGGSGLGLSITRKFAELHGGRVWVESEPGKGSSFFLAVPLRAAGVPPA